jgi:hypothetical protein
MTSQNETLGIQGKMENKEIEKISRHEIENSPFVAIGSTKEGWHIVCGNNRLTEYKLETLGDVYEYLETNNWQLISQLIAIMVPRILEERNKEPF